MRFQNIVNASFNNKIVTDSFSVGPDGHGTLSRMRYTGLCTSLQMRQRGIVLCDSKFLLIDIALTLLR